MKKKLSSVTFWLLIFFAIIVVEAYSSLAQAPDITGTWKDGSVGAIQYKDMITGISKPGRGSVFWYKFLPNGNYEFVGYMEISMYNCTTTLFNQIGGKYSVSGTTISLNPSKDFWKNTNSCAASSNKEQLKTPTKKSLEFQLKTDDYGNELLCVTEGKGESCFRREKE